MENKKTNEESRVTPMPKQKKVICEASESLAKHRGLCGTKQQCMENRNFKLLYNDQENKINVRSNISLGRLQEIILSKLNLSIYETHYLTFVSENIKDNLIFGIDLNYLTCISDFPDETIIRVIPKNKEHNKPYINKYLNYIQFVEDERMATQLQDQINSPTNIFNVLNNMLGSENNENNENIVEIGHGALPLPSNFNISNFTFLSTTTTPTTLDNHDGFQNLLQTYNILTNALMTLQSPEMNDVKIVNTVEELNNLKKIKFKDLKSLCKSQTCNICLNDYEGNDDLIILDCDHYFHRECIIPWFSKESNKCPICKERVMKGKIIK